MVLTRIEDLDNASTRILSVLILMGCLVLFYFPLLGSDLFWRGVGSNISRNSWEARTNSLRMVSSCIFMLIVSILI